MFIYKRNALPPDSCEATFLDPAAHLDRDSEFARYKQHDNSIEDERYAAFLSRLAKPLIKFLPPHRKGLDFGCGPGPLLSLILEKAGHVMKNYDPFFCPDKSALNAEYDFITCSETAEHFYRPAEEFAFLDSMLRPGGLLAVMTSFLKEGQDFEKWRYRRDDTHVVFYSECTFKKIAQHLDWEVLFPARNVAFLLKPACLPVLH